MEIKSLVHVIVSTLVCAGVIATTSTAIASPKKSVEKCYGIVKAKKNDCGTPQHACAGQAKMSGDPNEWIFVLKGNCERIVNGSLTPQKASAT